MSQVPDRYNRQFAPITDSVTQVPPNRSNPEPTPLAKLKSEGYIMMPADWFPDRPLENKINKPDAEEFKRRQELLMKLPADWADLEENNVLREDLGISKSPPR